ncbi:MAG TPA: diheme cytochrome c-553 [Candidatus Krumholzibacteria bacterium]|nr:diheme cytochrome c-553 [Candidatus Krumholzibacteria bacterium]
MEKRLMASLALLVSVCLASSAAAAPEAAAKIAHGKYMVQIMACNDCHTPWKMGPNGPEPDMTRMLSGHPQQMVMPDAPAAKGPWMWAGAATNTAFAGPWGVSFAANLTPDKETGLGDWTEETFIQALRSGRHQGQGRPIMPPMPWMSYRSASDEDLSAIYAYLQSIPAIVNQVPQAIEPREAQ